MKTVRILCGGYGLKTHTDSGLHTKLIPRGEICEVSDEEAAELIASKMAELVVATPSAVPPEDVPSGSIPGDSEAQSEVLEATLNPTHLSTRTIAQLKELAKDMGLDCAGCRTKADYVALISADCVKAEEAAVDDGERLPDVRAEAPVG